MLKKGRISLLVFMSCCAITLKAQHYHGDVNNDGEIDVSDITTLTDLILENKSQEEMLFSKEGTALSIYFHKEFNHYIKIPFTLRKKDFKENEYPSYYDNWGIGTLSFVEFNENNLQSRIAYLFRSGEAELAMNVRKPDNAFEYTGGGTAHGFEVIKVSDGERQISINVDGRELSESENVDLTSFSNISIEQHSIIYMPRSNTDIIANVTKKWQFSNSEIRIETSAEFVKDVELKQAQFGMVCAYRHYDANASYPYLTNRAIKGNSETIYKIEDGWEKLPENEGLNKCDNSCYSITEYGMCGFRFIFESLEDSREANGGMFISTNSSSYNKMYLDVVGKTNTKYKQGDTLYSKTRLVVK